MSILLIVSHKLLVLVHNTHSTKYKSMLRGCWVMIVKKRIFIYQYFAETHRPISDDEWWMMISRRFRPKVIQFMRCDICCGRISSNECQKGLSECQQTKKFRTQMDDDMAFISPLDKWQRIYITCTVDKQ